MSKRMEAFDKLIDSHQHRHIPLDLGHVIQLGIRNGKTECQRRTKRGRWFWRIFLACIIVLSIFVVGLNYSADFNAQLRQITGLSDLIERLQFNDALGAGDVDTDYREQSNEIVYRLITSDISDAEVLAFIKDALRTEYPNLKVIEKGNGKMCIEIGDYKTEAEAKLVMEGLEAFLSAQKIHLNIEKTRTVE